MSSYLVPPGGMKNFSEMNSKDSNLPNRLCRSCENAFNHREPIPDFPAEKERQQKNLGPQPGLLAQV
jgi:hypothetical protein